MARLAAAALACLFAHGIHGTSSPSFDSVTLMQLQAGSRSVDASDIEAQLPPWKRNYTQVDALPRESGTRPRGVKPEAGEVAKSSITSDLDDGKGAHYGDKWWMAPAGTVHPKDGQIFLGELTCNMVNMGVRVTVNRWPSDIRVWVFPAPFVDFSQGRWCPPIHTCTAGFESHAVVEEDVVNITPTVNGESNTSFCGWPEFSMTGSFYTLEDGLHAKGSLYEPNGYEGQPFFYAHHSEQYSSRFSQHCKQLHQGVLGSWGGGGVGCTKFDMRPCNGRSARSGERVLYFMRSFAGDGPGDMDPQLKNRDRKLALSQKNQPLFWKAFGDEPDRRADIIYVAPTVRAVESAAYAFGMENVTIVVDPRLKDHKDKFVKANFKASISALTNEGYLYPHLASRMMDDYDAMQAMSKGKNLESDILGSNSDRISSFFGDLLKRPEKRVVIVAHQNMIQYAGGYVDMPGGVESRILLQNGALSAWTHDPFCFGAL